MSGCARRFRRQHDVFAAVLAFLWVLNMLLPPSYGSGWRRRSQFSVRDRRRRCNKHGILHASNPALPLSLVAVPAHLAQDARDMVTSKELKLVRESQTGSASHSTRLASVAAFKAGEISEAQLRVDSIINRRGNRARHGSFIGRWEMG